MEKQETKTIGTGVKPQLMSSKSKHKKFPIILGWLELHPLLLHHKQLWLHQPLDMEI